MLALTIREESLRDLGLLRIPEEHAPPAVLARHSADKFLSATASTVVVTYTTDRPSGERDGCPGKVNVVRSSMRWRRVTT